MILIFSFVRTTLAAWNSRAENPGRARQVVKENQPRADLGNGYYQNPILSGHYHDPTVVRVGKDYYMTHYADPRLLIWHSRDLVNWRPISKALSENLDFWAPELIYYKGLFYIYIPVQLDQRRWFSNFVLTAKNPVGPWSQPVDLKFGGIDPGHITTPDGSRYIYVNMGRYIQLAPDGLSAVGELKEVYKGWKYPEDWVVEGLYLEGPKLFFRNGYYYMVSAQGGTAGPSTAHMIIVARSKYPTGPWENSPLNPMVRTSSRNEDWWTQGHGTFIDDVDGKWWVVYHAYQKDRRILGRNTVLLPVEWTVEGWPEVPGGVTASHKIKKPTGENVGHGMPRSDDFTSGQLGLQWMWAERGKPGDTYQPGGGRLRMKAKGSSVAEAAKLVVMPVNISYEAEVEIEFPDTAEAGLLLWNGYSIYSGAAVKKGSAFTYWVARQHTRADFNGNHIFLRFRNIENDVALFYSSDGMNWQQFDKSIEVSSTYDLGRVSRSFDTLRITLYASGQGDVVFRNFKYRGID